MHIRSTFATRHLRAGWIGVLSALLAVAIAAAQEPGVWTGTTSQGRIYEMTLAAGAITQIKIGWAVCGGGMTGIATISTNTPVTVGGSFNVNAGGVCPGINISGTLTSSSTASGSATFTTSYIPYACPCTSTTTPTWSAAAPGFTLAADPDSANACSGADAVYSVAVASVGGFTEPVTLSLPSPPAGATVSFSTNPVTPPGSSTLTLGTASVAPGAYPIQITGTAGDKVRSTSVWLYDSATPPMGVTTLLTPADGSTGSPVPLYSWAGHAEAFWYDLEVASDIDFTDLVHSAASLAGTSHTGPPLAESATFHWRLAPVNACGVGMWSGPATFTTEPLALLYDNGPIVNCTGCGSGGADTSQVQDSLGMTSYGFSAAWPTVRLADDFTVPAGVTWRIDAVRLLAYQTNAPLDPTPISGAGYQIWLGAPDEAGSSLQFGDATTDRMAASQFTGNYRTSEATPASTSRAVWAIVASGGARLLPGKHWLDWQIAGSAAYSGPWVPPLTIDGETTTGDALLKDSSWAAILDGGTSTPQGLPFILFGVAEALPSEIFVDGFESGGTAAWSATVPGG